MSLARAKQRVFGTGVTCNCFITMLSTRGCRCMNIEMDDHGGSKELALYRIEVAKEDLASAIKNLKMADYTFIVLWRRIH